MTLTSHDALASTLRATFRTGKTRDLSWRRAQLRALLDLFETHADAIAQAIHADMGRPALEGWALEVGVVQVEIRHALKQLDAWARPRKVASPLVNLPSRSYVQVQPKGACLIIGPWNYPVQLLLLPAMAAIAAGNTVALKPSELAPASSALVADLVPKYLDSDAVQVVTGGVETSQALLAQRWDHIFFTGGTAVGRIVMQAAAQHLTPVTLELGGKSPTLVAADADLEVAARRICWGKFVNAGQTCLAPDYVLVDAAVHDALLDALVQCVARFYGDDPAQSPDFGRIINERHHARVVGLLDGGGTPVCGGQWSAEERYIAPTVLRDVPEEAQVLQEEIFGPLLPVLPVADMDAAIDYVNARPHPLALYLFTRDAALRDRVLGSTQSGGACVNDTVSHAGVPDLPFGGVGDSGMGAYHGQVGFDEFSHLRGVVVRTPRLDVPLRYPPYEGKLTWVKRVLR